MRAAFSGLLVAGAILTASSATVAAPISPSVIKEAADEIAVAETVHCRRTAIGTAGDTAAAATAASWFTVRACAPATA